MNLSTMKAAFNDIETEHQDAITRAWASTADKYATLARMAMDELERKTVEQADTNGHASEPESIPVAELAEVLGCDADAASVRMRLEDITSEKDGPQPDADGWYEHDGKSWPACGLSEYIYYRRRNGDVSASRVSAGELCWTHRNTPHDIVAWRHTDGRDIERGEGS